jgi:[ribosomal protein S5]-alanine N-acetyltransferase
VVTEALVTEQERRRLATERLELVPISAHHTAFLHALWADPDVRRFLWDDRVIHRDEATAVVDASIESFERHGVGMWLLSLKPQLVPVGFCGLRHFGETAQEVEILYGLSPSQWRRGLATEAAFAVLAFAFQQARLGRVFAGTDPPNLASQRVIARLGMTYHGNRTINGLDVVYFAIDSESFAALDRGPNVASHT